MHIHIHIHIHTYICMSQVWRLRLEAYIHTYIYMSQVWRYAWTTAPTPLIELEERGSRPPQMLRRSALAGYGMGLPLSRL